MEGLRASMELGIRQVLGWLRAVVMALLPDDLSLPLLSHDLQWGTILCPPVLGFLVGLLFLFRMVQSVRSRVHARWEKQLADTLAALTQEKCQLLDKLRHAQKKDAETESALENGRLERESLNLRSLVNIYREKRLRAVLKELDQALAEERAKASQQEEVMAEMMKTLESLEEVLRATTAQEAFPQPGRLVSPDPTPIGGQ